MLTDLLTYGYNVQTKLELKLGSTYQEEAPSLEGALISGNPVPTIQLLWKENGRKDVQLISDDYMA